MLIEVLIPVASEVTSVCTVGFINNEPAVVAPVVCFAILSA